MGSPVFILRPESRGRVGGQVFSEFLGRRGMISLDPQRALSKGGSCPAVKPQPLLEASCVCGHQPWLSQSPALSTGPLLALVPFPSGATWLIPGNWTVHERFGWKVAIFVCLLAHSASKMVLIVPPGDFKHVAACPRWRARVPLLSIMMVGPASLAIGESLEDLRFLPGGARTRPPVGHWVSWLCPASPGASRPHRAALSS